MNKKIASEIVIGIILLLSIAVGWIVLDKKKDLSNQNYNINDSQNFTLQKKENLTHVNVNQSENLHKETINKKENLISSYSNLSGKTCNAINDKAEIIREECVGVAGYKLAVEEIDLRQTMSVISSENKEYKLDLIKNISENFSSLGERAEWRVMDQNGKYVPKALIVRFNVNDNPEDGSKVTSYLIVSKIASENICVVGKINSSISQNEQARVMADNSQSMPCLYK